MCRSHDLHRTTPTAPETQQCNVTIIVSKLPGEQRITDQPTRRAAREEKFSFRRSRQASLVTFFFKIKLLIYLYTQTCPRVFSVHFLQASIIAKFCHKVLKIKLKKKKYYTKNVQQKNVLGFALILSEKV